MAKEKDNKINRRKFLKEIGAVGLGTLLGAEEVMAASGDPNTTEEKKQSSPQVPRRKLGRTGIEVPCLSLGANRLDNQIILRSCVRRGITYWDTGPGYAGGNSELSIGKYLARSPRLRDKLFIVTKASGAKKIADLEERLQASLKRINTDYIDLYYGVHGLSDPSYLTDELKEWVEKAKKRRAIRFFGFSTHKNMAECLMAASKLSWIDAITTSYNFRLMQNDKMQAAVEACHKAGIGLIAMKTVGLSIRERNRLEDGKEIGNEEDRRALGRFLRRGLTSAQAKIKYVLEDERISSACVGMKNVSQITENTTAVLDKAKLSQAEREVLEGYAKMTSGSYCAGCAKICERALDDVPCVSDILRYLMYYNSYGDRAGARELFAQIPAQARYRLLSTDYSRAETCCPQHVPISNLIAEAVHKLA